MPIPAIVGSIAGQYLANLVRNQFGSNQSQGAVGDPTQFNIGADQDPYSPANYGMAGMNVSITPGGDVTQYFSPSDLAGMNNIFGLSPTNIATTTPFGVGTNIPYSYGTTGAMPGAGSDLTFAQFGQGGVTAYPTYGVGQENLDLLTLNMMQGGNTSVGSTTGQAVNLPATSPVMAVPASQGGLPFAQGVVTMPAFQVNESYLMPSTTDATGTQAANDPFQMSSYIAPSGGGGVAAAAATSTATTSVTPSGQGVTTMPAFNVNETPITEENLGFGGNLYQPFAGQLPGTITPGAGGVSTLNIAPQPTSTSTVTVTQPTGTPTTLPPFVVNEQPITPSTIPMGGNVSVSPQPVSVTPGATGGQIVQEGYTMPAVTAQSAPTSTTTSSNIVTLPPFQVPGTVPPATTVNQITPATVTPTITPVVPPITTPTITVPASTATTTATTTVTNTVTDTGTVPTGGTTTPTLPGIGGGQGRNYRDFGLELGETSAALRAKQADLLNMYGGIYQNFLNQTTIPQAATSSLADLAASQAKLDRVRAGQLSQEDIRNSQQAAREAYAARGQVMGPGAISSEILNRENIRQQREDQARAAYQSAMGNVLNTANLQTGNIFQPIGSLISGTFNPLSAYAADVYGTNVNAQLARDIANQNNAAAIQAAQFGANATRSAANTAATTNVVNEFLKSLFGTTPGR